MKLAVIGATGLIGTQVVPEALQRGHQVTAISRHPEAIAVKPGLSARKADVLVQQELKEAIAGHDALISCYNPRHSVGGAAVKEGDAHTIPKGSDVYMDFIEATRLMILAVKRKKVPYLLFVGGAGSLYIEPGMQFIDAPGFPFKFLAIAPKEHIDYMSERTGASLEQLAQMAKTPPYMLLGCRAALCLFEHDRTFDWTFLSPPWFLRPGERTGRYRECGEELPRDGELLAGISVEDLAVAIVDDIERRKHTHQHWAVASVGKKFGQA